MSEYLKNKEMASLSRWMALAIAMVLGMYGAKYFRDLGTEADNHAQSEWLGERGIALRAIGASAPPPHQD